MKTILNKLFEYKPLTEQQAFEILTDLANNKINDSQKVAFLTTFCMRSLTVEELTGFIKAMKELCLPIDLNDYDIMDLCGTGGDGKNTFNISTLSAFVVAGAGQKVAKHGNNGVSSACGSSNVLDALGIKFVNDTDKLKKCLDKAGICFLHAPLFHPAMKQFVPIRKELGIKTFFNALGPMVNPANPKKQLIGVYNLELARAINYIFQKKNKVKNNYNYCIVHALDGYDEISLTGDVKIYSHGGENVLKPSDFSFNMQKANAIEGGDSIEKSAKIFLDILKNKGTKEQENVVLANAGLALHCANNITIAEGVNIARESLNSGAAHKVFKNLLSVI